MSSNFFLKKALESKKLFHAYLLVGGTREKKSSLAVELAKVLNCSHKKEASTWYACGVCRNCRWIAENQHSKAVFTLKPEESETGSSREIIKVEQVQTLLGFLQQKSSFYRLVYIEQAEREFLGSQVANSLLKTIEESPERVVFIFSSSDREKVLPTIVSRVQTLYFSEENQPKTLKQQESCPIVDKIIDRILKGKVSWSESKELLAKLSEKSSKKETEQKFWLKELEQLQRKLLEKLFYTGQTKKTEETIELTEAAIKDLKSFCQPKHTFKLLLYQLGIIYNSP